MQAMLSHRWHLVQLCIFAPDTPTGPLSICLLQHMYCSYASAQGMGNGGCFVLDAKPLAVLSNHSCESESQNQETEPNATQES